MEMVLRPGFEPGSGDRESPMLGRTTIGVIVQKYTILYRSRKWNASPEREKARQKFHK